MGTLTGVTALPVYFASSNGAKLLKERICIFRGKVFLVRVDSFYEVSMTREANKSSEKSCLAVKNGRNLLYL